jgi:tetratricopeptide (TPR) repeat protein
MQDFDGAMADFNKAIELNTEDPFAFNNRGCLKNKLRDFLGAIEDFNKAISINPNYGYAYMNRGISKENLRDVSGACKDWNEATLNGVEVAKTYIDADCK